MRTTTTPRKFRGSCNGRLQFPLLLIPSLLHSFLTNAMKLMKIPKNLTPKRWFGSRKDRSDLSRSDPSSFSSATSESYLTNRKPDSVPGFVTPTSVLPHVSGDWSASDIHLELAHAIKLIDRDNDGVISRCQLEALLSRLGAQPPSHEEVSTMLGEVDRDGDGCISVEALMSRIWSACEPAGHEELREAFVFFDSDHDGKITAEELLDVFTSFGDERCTLDECRRMIAEVDKNGDGFVCFEDFARMMELQR